VIAFAGAGGRGEAAIGGRAPAPAAGGRGTGRGGAVGANPLPGGRAGILMRAVSRDGCEPVAGSTVRGGKVIRTVSFLGSFESAISVPGKVLIKKWMKLLDLSLLKHGFYPTT